MPEDNATTLTCPSCGAPLELDGTRTIVQCKFCKSNILLPGMKAERAGASPETLREIRSLAKSGNMMEAIRRYRENFGGELKEAKNAVEQLASGGTVEAKQVVVTPLSAVQVGQVLEQVQDLLKRGNKLDAIRHYREATDVSLTKAKEVVERVEAALSGLSTVSFAAAYTEEDRQAVIADWKQYKFRRRYGWLMGVGIVLLMLGILIPLWIGSGGLSNLSLVAYRPAVLLNTRDDGADIAASFYNIDDETHMVGVIDGENGNLLWRSAPLPGEGYADGITQDGGLLFVASEMRLQAYSLEEGSLAWQMNMPDVLDYGEATLLVTDGMVLTMNLDRSIQAYNTQSGILAWSRRLEGYDRGLRMAGDSLLLIDHPKDDYEYNVLLLNPRNGSEESIFTPECALSEYNSATLSPSSGVLYDQDENALYLVFDSSNGCVQRLDLGSGQVTWQTVDEDWYSFSPGEFQALLTEEWLYFNHDSVITAVDKSTGAMKTIVQEEDYDLLPMVASGELLLVRAKRTRGTERFELWGIDRFSGETKWVWSMSRAEPIDPPDEMAGLVDDEDAGWTWRLNGDQLQVLTFRANPHRLTVENINMEDGSLIDETSIVLKGLSGNFYSIPIVIGWEGDIVYFIVDGMVYSIDVAEGNIQFHY